MKTILILRDKKPSFSYIVDTLAREWVALGYRVVDHVGSRDLPDADLVFLHIDRTVVAEEFVQCTARYPVVINGRALDISRRRYSTAQVTRTAEHRGPVIVKTVLNFGGVPEHSNSPPLARFAKFFFRREYFLAIRQFATWRTLSSLNPRHYPIFERIGRVPAGVWENENLIVEKFIPEREGDLYFVRYWTFLGDAEVTGRLGSRQRIVKFDRCETPDTPVEIPAELRQLRVRLGLDYGRFDFVVHAGRAVVLDVNKTQGNGVAVGPFVEQMRQIAAGIGSFAREAT